MRKSLRRPLMIAFICRTSVAWLSTWAFYICCHFLSLPGYIWPQDINLKVFHSVSFRIEDREVDIEEPQIGRLQLGSCFGPEWFRNWQFHILAKDKSSDCCCWVVEQKLRPILDKMQSVRISPLFISLHFCTNNIYQNELICQNETGPTSSSRVNRELGTCGSLGQKLAAVLWWIIPLWEWNRAVWD